MTTDIPDTLESRQARRFLRNVAMGTLAARLFVDGFLDLLDDPDLADGGRPFVHATDRLLDRLGFATGVADIAAVYDACAEQDLGFWLGAYTLVTPGDAVYILDVYPRGARLLDRASGAVWWTEQRLANTTLAFDTPLLRGTIRFSSAFQRLDGNPLPAAAMEPTCEAELERGPSGHARPLTLQGKRRCFTPEGVRTAGDGDPLGTWLGSYQMTDPDGTMHPEPLVIGGAGATDPAVSWRGVIATDVGYRGNLMRARLGEQRCSLFFEMTDGGRKRLLMVWDDRGEERHAIGSWLGFIANASAAADIRNADEAPTVSAPVTSQRSIALNCSASPKPVFTWLPLAVEKNDYAITLVATSEGQIRTDAAWTLSDQGSLPPTLGVLDDQGNGTALFQVSPGETQNAGFYSFTVSATIAGAAHAFVLRLQVSSTPTIALTPSDLPDATRGKPYKVMLGATGGGTTGGAPNRIELLNDLTMDHAGHYIKREMPDGIEWLPGNGSSAPLVSGSATRSQSGYALAFKLWPGDGRLQNPVQEFRSLSVVEPEQRLGELRGHAWASSISAWVQTLAVCASGAYFIVRHAKDDPDPTVSKIGELRDTLDLALNGQDAPIKKLIVDRDALLEAGEANVAKARRNAASVSRALQVQSEALESLVTELSRSLQNSAADFAKARREGAEEAMRDIQTRIDAQVREAVDVALRRQQTDTDQDRNDHDSAREHDVATPSAPP